MGTLAAIAVVETGLPSRSLRGDIVISIIRSWVADANTTLNTQAKTGVEVRQRIVRTIRRHIELALLELS
jgi:hypothetical protein